MTVGDVRARLRAVPAPGGPGLAASAGAVTGHASRPDRSHARSPGRDRDAGHPPPADTVHERRRRLRPPLRSPAPATADGASPALGRCAVRRHRRRARARGRGARSRRSSAGCAVAARRRRRGDHRPRPARLEGADGRPVRDERQDRRSMVIVAAAVLAFGALIGLARAALADSPPARAIVVLTGVGALAGAPRPGTAMADGRSSSWRRRPPSGYLALTQLLSVARPRPGASRGPGSRGTSSPVPGLGRRARRAGDRRAGHRPRACSTPGPRTRPRPARRSPRPSTPRRASAPTTAFAIAGLTPARRPQRRLLPHRHRAPRPVGGRRARWSLRVHGMVDREVTLTFDELVALPLIERYVTIACVSNEVGGDLVGNAKWTGVLLTDVLEMAGRPGRRDPDRAAVGRRLDGRLPHRVGHRPGAAARRADRREDERRAAARPRTGSRPGSSSRACTATCRRPSG